MVIFISGSDPILLLILLLFIVGAAATTTTIFTNWHECSSSLRLRRFKSIWDEIL